MKHQISPTSTTATATKTAGVSSSTSTTPSRLRVSSKSKDSLRAETMNGSGVSLSPSSKPRAKSAPLDTNLLLTQRPRRPKSGEDVFAVVAASSSSSPSQEPRPSDDVKPVGRLGNRPAVEQFSRPRRQRLVTNPNSKKNESEGLNEKEVKELREKLDQTEALIRNLQSEVLELKAELDKARDSNADLESRNIKLSKDLAAAEAKIATLTIRDQREPVVDYQFPKFKDIQKLIATKLEQSKVKNEASNDLSPSGVQMTSSKEPIPMVAAVVQRNVPAIPSQPPPPPPLPPRAPAKAAMPPKASTVVKLHPSPTKLDTAEYTSRSGNHNSRPITMSAHSSIVGEIQKRSLHLLAVRADVETKGELINCLIQKVLDAAFTDIEDVLKFVDWLDNELSSLADERAVLKHFTWPEKKADSMREAAVEYRSLKVLESEVSSYKDDSSIPPGVALKKTAGLLDKSERSIQRLIKLRNSVMFSYQHFKIPTDWMLETGIISKIKQASMMLAKIYMKRVTMELESIPYSERESAQGGLLLQGIHLAYRAHQFAGGLDSETLCAFEDIRQRVPGHLRGSQELFAGIPSS